jgi:hypothetical protein
MSGVLYIAFRLQNGVTDSLEETLPVEQALVTIQRDLANIVCNNSSNNLMLIGSFQTINQTNVLPPGRPRLLHHRRRTRRPGPRGAMSRKLIICSPSPPTACMSRQGPRARRHPQPPARDQPHRAGSETRSLERRPKRFFHLLQWHRLGVQLGFHPANQFAGRHQDANRHGRPRPGRAASRLSPMNWSFPWMSR